MLKSQRRFKQTCYPGGCIKVANICFYSTQGTKVLIFCACPENPGERCFLRLERQTLSRLPATRAILFTIHTYNIPIAAVAADPDHARRLAGNLRTMPPALQRYKGLDRYADALLAYLDRAART